MFVLIFITFNKCLRGTGGHELKTMQFIPRVEYLHLYDGALGPTIFANEILSVYREWFYLSRIIHSFKKIGSINRMQFAKEEL